MFPRIDNLIEQWATQYRPIAHIPQKGSKQRRFFRFDSLDKAIDMTSQFAAMKGPVAGIVTQFDGMSRGNLIELEVVVFIFTKQSTPRSDAQGAELAAVDAKMEGADICNDLWIWLSEKKREVGNNTKHENYWLRGLDLDSIAIMSYPVMLNDWWPTSLEIKVKIPRQTCSDASKYIND
ncbi:MAG: hypothetical protein IJ557_02410 [Bacteroidaceae bacterium]|nr:hypothetical protein [Bacteroidaceae bacterium]